MGHFETPLLVRDVNGDDIPDILASATDGFTVLLGGSHLTFSDPKHFAVGTYRPFGTQITNYVDQIVDIDGDRVLDVVDAGANSIFITHGRPDGTFDTAPTLESRRGPRFYDGCGLQRRRHPRSRRQRRYPAPQPGQGRRHLSPFHLHPAGAMDVRTSTSQLNSHIAHGDFNGDGKQDILALGAAEFGQYNLYVFLGHGDGKLDAAVGAYRNTYVLRGHGDGSFDSTGTLLPIPPLAQGGQQGAVAVAAGDFDGDGNQDIAVLSTYGIQAYEFATRTDYSAVFVYFGAGDGTFSAPVTAATFNRSYGMVHAADLNQDGRSDLILSQGSPYAAAATYFGIVHALPGRTFGPEVNYTIGPGLSSLAVADMNRNGLPDLVIANGDYTFHNGAATILLNLGNIPAVTGTLYATPEPSAVGQTFTLTASLTPPAAATLTGSIAFTIDGAGSAPLVGNVASISIPGNLAVGSHTLAATWPGNTTYPSLTLTGRHVVTGLASTTTTLSANPNPAYQGANVVFSANVLPAGGSSGANPSGTVQFLDGGTPLGPVPLAGSAAVFTTDRLSPGQHRITAIYSGNGTLSGSTSAPLTETILLSDINLSSTPATLSLRTGHHLTFTVTATSIGTFADTLTLSSQALPLHASTSFPHGVFLSLASGAGASVQVYLDTDDLIGYLSRAETTTSGPRHPQPSGSVLYACLPAGLLALLRLLRRKKQLPFLLTAVGVLLLGAASGCSGKYPSSTAPGSYIFRISATGSATGTIHTIDIPLTVAE